MISTMKRLRLKGKPQTLNSPLMNRVLDFTRIRANVNQIILETFDSGALLQAFCDTAVHYGNLKLAFIAKPNEAGVFEVVAASGEVGYTDGLLISTNPDVPEGQGSMGQAWLYDTAFYNQDISTVSFMTPWHERAAHYGFRSSATIVIHLDGERWGALSVYHGEPNVFDHSLQMLFEQLRDDFSRGLSWVTIIERERQQSAIQKILLDNTIASISMIRNRCFVYVNPRFLQMLGYSSVNDVLGKPTHMVYPDDHEYQRIGMLYESMRTNDTVVAEDVRLTCADGRTILVDISAGLLSNDDSSTSVWTMEDVTERRALQRKLQQQAFHDELTNLPNRRALGNELESAIFNSEHNGMTFAVGVLDLDDFKRVNDTLGHETGDRLLVSFSDRIMSLLTKNVFVSRIGGDEFVLIIHELDRQHYMQQIKKHMDTIQHIMEIPFSLNNDVNLFVQLSLGLAIYKEDGEDGDILIRNADAALYQIKSHKMDRDIWWQKGVISGLDHESVTIDPYGALANHLLQDLEGMFAEMSVTFVNKNLQNTSIAQDMDPLRKKMSTDEFNHFLERISEHIRFIFAPSSSKEMVRDAAEYAGRLYTLMGLSDTFLVQCTSFYRELLNEELNKEFLSIRNRYLLLMVSESRLQDDLISKLYAAETTTNHYFSTLLRPIPNHSVLWVDTLKTEVEILCSLPGILGVRIWRPNSEGLLTLEYSLESSTVDLQYELDDAACLDFSEVTLREWTTREIITHPIRLFDENHLIQLDSMNVPKSCVVIPIINGNDLPVLILELVGVQFNQFESPWMSQYTLGLQQRWREIELRQQSTRQKVVLPQDVTQKYRQELFSGGLSMYAQPIVNLKTGELIKFEALARLHMSDGSIVPPDQFLPLLGDNELSTLFLMSLEQSLEFLNNLDSLGIYVGISVNMAPSTLFNPELLHWVNNALHTFKIAPDRLTIELLENQILDQNSQISAMRQLTKAGVQLAIDDLGSGYSSLNRLLEYSFHSIKIDRGAIKDIYQDPVRNIILINTLSQLASDLQREAVVEGLEDIGMLEASSFLGVGFGQGYVISHPMPMTKILEKPQMDGFGVDHVEIRTFLGALAYHWKTTHVADSNHPYEFSACPLTKFFEQQGFSDDEVAKWHKQLHETTTSQATDLSNKISRWLINRVKAQNSA